MITTDMLIEIATSAAGAEMTHSERARAFFCMLCGYVDALAGKDPHDELAAALGFTHLLKDEETHA